jgi:hypothetical protein
MSCHVECQDVRTVEIKRLGGRDEPQRRLVIEVRREEEGFGGCLRDILGLTWWWRAGMGRWEMRRKVLAMFLNQPTVFFFKTRYQKIPYRFFFWNSE